MLTNVSKRNKEVAFLFCAVFIHLSIGLLAGLKGRDTIDYYGDGVLFWTADQVRNLSLWVVNHIHSLRNFI